MAAPELGGKRAHDQFRELQESAVAGWQACAGILRLAGRREDRGRLQERTEGRGVRSQIVPTTMPHKGISPRQGLLGAECRRNHVLPVFYLPANYVLLTIPVSSDLDSCSSG